MGKQSTIEPARKHHTLGTSPEDRLALKRLGAALKKERLAQGLTLSETALKVRSSYQALWGIESGRHWPSMPLYLALCEKLNLAIPPLTE